MCYYYLGLYWWTIFSNIFDIEDEFEGHNEKVNLFYPVSKFEKNNNNIPDNPFWVSQTFTGII